MARTGRGFPARAIVHRFRGETSAPTYSVNPASFNTGDTYVDTNATAIDDLGGLLDHYVACYVAGSTPTAAQVIAGTGTGFIAGTNWAQIGIASGSPATFTRIPGLSNGHPYRAAFTVRDSYGNLASVFYLDFYTIVGLATRADVEVEGVAGVLANPRTITLSALAYRSGTVRDNLSGLHWAWFDADDPALMGAPAEKGTTATTDAFGNLAITLTTTALTSGQYGRLILETNDQASLGHYRVVIP